MLHDVAPIPARMIPSPHTTLLSYKDHYLFFHGISPGFDKKSRTKPQLSHLPMALETEHEVAESWGPW